MKILKLLPFALTIHGDLGIADANGSFASSAWCISDELFKTISGSKFGWYGPDGEFYTENSDLMKRPTEQQVIAHLKLSAPLTKMAIEKGYISITS